MQRRVINPCFHSIYKTQTRSYAKPPIISPHTALFYKYVPDAVEKREPFRVAHLKHAAKAKEEGKLVHGGAFEPASDGALIVFKGDCRDYAEQFASNDPYVTGKVVLSYEIKKWNTVDIQSSDTYVEQ